LAQHQANRAGRYFITSSLRYSVASLHRCVERRYVISRSFATHTANPARRGLNALRGISQQLGVDGRPRHRGRPYETARVAPLAVIDAQGIAGKGEFGRVTAFSSGSPTSAPV